MVRIGLVGLPYDDNLGDPLMIECVKQLCIHELDNKYGTDNIEFKIIDLMARKDTKTIQVKKNMGYYFLVKSIILCKILYNVLPVSH